MLVASADRAEWNVCWRGEVTGLPPGAAPAAAPPPRSELGRRTCTGRGAGGLVLPAASARWASCFRASSGWRGGSEAGATAGREGEGASLGRGTGSAAALAAVAGCGMRLPLAWRLKLAPAAAAAAAPGVAAGEAAPEELAAAVPMRQLAVLGAASLAAVGDSRPPAAAAVEVVEGFRLRRPGREGQGEQGETGRQGQR